MSLGGRSIVTRIVGSIFLFSVAITALAGFLAYRQVSSSLRQSIEDRLATAVGMKEVELRRMVDQQKESVEVFSRLPDLQRHAKSLIAPGSPAAHAAVKTALTTLLPRPSIQRLGWREVLLLEPRAGQVVFSSEPEHEGDFRHEDQFFKVGTSHTFIQNVYPWPVTLQPTLTISTPLRDATGGLIGVLVVHLSLDRMDEIVTGGLGRSGETYLIDRYNSFVSSQRFGRNDFPRGVHTEGIDAAIRGQDGAGMYDNYRGTPVVGVYRWLPDLELALIAEVAQVEALAPARRLALVIGTISLAGALLLMGGIYLLAVRIARPILAIKDTAAAVTRGDLDAVAPILTADEVGILAASFNEMTARLRNHQADLERQVASRTAELERALVDAQQASRAKSAFVSSMSHELRTPLNAILGYAQLMGLGESDPADYQMFAGKIMIAGEHLLGLVNDVLSVAKIEENRLELLLAPFELRALVRSVEGMLGARARGKGLSLEIGVDPALPAGILGDEGRLRQVLLNLVGNAVKFTAQGRVALQMRATPEGRLQVAVSDTGPGIPPEDLPNLFGSFVQSEVGKRTTDGAGLGLYLSQSFVRLMGGEITVSSVLGQGSTFTFELPMTVTDAPPSEEALHRGFRLVPGQVLPTQLVVDDLEDNREVLAAFLRGLGLTVHTARDGREAVEAWEAWRPGVVWMDMHMPIEDGFSATRRIRALERTRALPRTPILGITASVFELEQASVLEAGCDTLVPKPYREAHLIEALQQFAGLRFEEAPHPDPQPGASTAPPAGLPEAWRRGFREDLAKGDLDGAARRVQELPVSAKAFGGRLLDLLREFRLEELERLVPPAEGPR